MSQCAPLPPVKAGQRHKNMRAQKESAETLTNLTAMILLGFFPLLLLTGKRKKTHEAVTVTGHLS